MRIVCVVALFACVPAIVMADSEAAHPPADAAQTAAEGEHGAQRRSGEEAAGHGGPLTLKSVLSNPEFWAACVNFFVLLLILRYAVKKFGNPALAARRAEVEQSLQEAQKLKAQAQEAHAKYQSRLDKLDSEIDQLRADMVKAGEVERDRIVADAEEKAARMRREVTFLIEQQMKELRKTLTEETILASIKNAESLLKTATSAADQDRLADAYLQRLDDLSMQNDGGQA